MDTHMVVLVSVDEGDVTIHGVFTTVVSAITEIMNLTKMDGIPMSEFTTSHDVTRSYMYLNHCDADLVYILRDVIIPEVK